MGKFENRRMLCHPHRFALCFRLCLFLHMLPFIAGAQDRAEAPLFELIGPETSGIGFSNHIIESDTFYMSVFIYAYNGGGVAVGDINRDGLPDLYFSGTQTHSPSRLYLNKGGMRFEDISASAGVLDSVGVRFGLAMIDIDGDDDLDIYVCKQDAPNRLYINNGDLTFTDKAKEFGLDYCCSSTQGSFFDYDNDGDLDLYLGINGQAFERHPMVKGLPDKLFRNDDGIFRDVSEEAGIHDEGYALSVTVGDINEDGRPDIYVTNDFSIRDRMYINNGDGTFTNGMEQLMRHTSAASMGSDIADFNNDGLLDIVGLDMMPETHWRKMSNATSLSTFSPVFDSTQLMRNTLLMNRGLGYFSDIGQYAGMSETDWSWGPLVADYDNDGHKDLFITNGFKRDVLNLDITQYFNPHISRLDLLQQIPELRLPNYVFRNNGNLTFTNMTETWNANQIVNSNGIAFGDFDVDGDLDLVINNLDSVPFILKNQAVEQKRGAWLQVVLEGEGKNSRGIGARLYVRQKGKQPTTQMQEMIPVRSYLSSMEYLLHFGLGLADRIDELEVRWPDGARQLLTNVKVNQRLRLRRKDARDPDRDDKESAGEGPVAGTIFRQEPSGRLSPFRHIENSINDFYRERLLPRRFSISGPGMAVGDVNGDGLEDLWLGQGRSTPGRILLQRADGSFLPSDLPEELTADSLSEDLGGIFFDADDDGDLDLYVVSGGDEVGPERPELQDRLYRNNGKGGFERDSTALPEMRTSGSCIAAADYDNDGDADLFVSGRVVPGLYGEAPRSYLLRNTNGKFVDVTAEVAPELLHPGMVSSALWTDYDNDGDPDLMIVGEWMTPRLYRNQNGTFADVTSRSGLEGFEGWWNSLMGADLDGDGDIDYVAGNLGLNTKPELQASSSHPLQLHVNDFDGNGSRDLIISYYYRGKQYPTRNKADLAMQMGTYIKRKFPTTSAYALATLPEILPVERLDSADVRKVHTFSSLCFRNNGDGTFSPLPLPPEAQFAPIHGMTTEDFNGDGVLDLLLNQNFYGPDGTVIRYDAGIGLFLRGLGDGTFVPVRLDTAGFLVNCDARSMVTMRKGRSDSLYILSACNAATGALHSWSLPGTRILTIPIGERVTHAILVRSNGTEERREFYCGSGYLSQNSPTLVLSPSIREVHLYRGTIRLRTITP